jgi:3-deoxy-D-manno-octulosonic-acid transferase
MHVLYDILIHLAFILLIPYFILRMVFEGRYRSGLAERFGLIPREKLKALSPGRVVWFHAVSVGETKAVLPLVRLFKKTHPRCKVLFSTVTSTGNRVAEAEGAGVIDSLIYLPLDLGWVVRGVVRAVAPEAFIVVEKEVWPNLVKTLDDRGVPVVVVNGTVSDGSFKRYRLFSFFFRPVFSKVGFFCARTEEDGQRARELGVERGRVVFTGNLKFDLAPGARASTNAATVRERLGIEPDAMVIVAGSTHAGEEAMLITAYAGLKPEFPDLKLIIAPRHPERFDEVETLLKERGVSYTRRSRGGGSPADVLLLDTIGELSGVYEVSTIAFVGGTLVDTGGHNLLEPAFYGKPVVYGPFLKSYLYMAEMLEEAGGGVRVRPEELTQKLRGLLTDAPLRGEKGRAAVGVVEKNRGATERCAHVIEEALEAGGGAVDA